MLVIEVGQRIKKCSIIIKNTMKYLKRLVQNVCGQQQQQNNNIFRRIRIKKTNNSIHNNNYIQQQQNTRNEIDVQKIKNIYYQLNQQQKGIKVPSIKIQGNFKILLLDLDKTLIYYSQQHGFTCRPFLKQFLKTVRQFYRIYIFTASTAMYLEQMIKKMKDYDCDDQYFQGYLTRENCVGLVVGREKVVYIKDINVLCNCDQSKIVVVDDTPIAYCLNPDNAVPILPYFGESFDNGLFFLSKTLLEVKDYEDVREYIRGRYTFNINSLQTVSSDEGLSHSFLQSNIPKIILKRHRSQ